MTAEPAKQTEPLHVHITTGPHGRKTNITIDGEPVRKARAFTLSTSVDGATTLTIEYIHVEVEVDALIDETAFEATNKTYRRVRLVEEPDDE